jgi:hypothetical protein
MDPTLLTVVIVLVVFAGAGVFLFLKTRKKAAKADDNYYSFNCPNCRRKLRYRTRQAGHSGMCPRCNTPCTFPAAPKG